MPDLLEMDEELQRLLSELVGALEALLVTMQVEHGAQAESDDPGYSLREAVRRVNLLRRAVEGLRTED